MTKNAKLMLVVTAMLIGTAVFARPPHGRHHHKRDGLDIANGIVDLVLKVVAPQPQVVVAPQPVVVAPQPPPVVVAPQPPPVVVAPQPVVVAPQPVYYTRPAPRPPQHRPHYTPARGNHGNRHRR